MGSWQTSARLISQVLPPAGPKAGWKYARLCRLHSVYISQNSVPNLRMRLDADAPENGTDSTVKEGFPHAEQNVGTA